MNKNKIEGHPVFAIDLSTLKVSRFHSQYEASRELGLLQPSINVVKSKLHGIGKTGLKIKHRAVN